MHPKKTHLLLALSCTLMFYVISPLQLVAQKVDMDYFKDMKTRSIGPAGMSGRVTTIDVVNDHPEIIYVGTASGGLWKSKSGGIQWEPIFDKEAVSSIGAVAIQQSNPDVIWAGTGEGNPRNSLNGGYGIYKSLDGGKNWKLMGLEKTRNIHRIIIHRDNPNIVFAAAIGSPWGEHPERGVYKTIDGGSTWEKVLYVDTKTGCADLITDPSNPNKLIAAMWQHRRKPWTFNSGGPGSGLYVSFDAGKTWERRDHEDGLPKGDLGRIGLALSQSKPEVVYALVEAKKNALYRSEDGGFKWTKVNDKNEIGNRPFYYSDIFVDPSNENRVYSLFSFVNVSEDGGKSFRQLMPAYNTDVGVHPDHHAWWIHPEDPSFMMDGNDGGLNITHDGGKTWRFVANLPVAQFYHISVDNEIPYNVYGGMQDNGSWAGPAYVWKAQGIRNSYWQEILFGDGFDVVPDAEDSRFGFAMSQQGFVGRYDRKTGYAKIVRPTHPDIDTKLRFNWNAAIAQDPFDAKTLYFGSQFVHKSSNRGDSWELISPDLTTNNPDQQQQHLSGGLTMDATGAENYNTILVISPSTVQKGLLWVGTDDGQVHISQNDGASWQNLTANIKGAPKNGWVPQIKPSTYKAGEAFVLFNNYRNFDFKPYAFKTSDFGKTWKPIVGTGDVEGYVLSLVQDTVVPDLLFLGTEQGLYMSIDAGSTWTKWTAGYPTVPTMDLTIHPREQDLVIGTYGRAAYVLDDIRPLRELASSKGSALKDTLQVYAAPDAYLAANQQPAGTRFGANAVFNGENRKRGAMITYSITKAKPDEIATSDKEEKNLAEKKDSRESTVDTKPHKSSYDSITMEVFNVKGRLIRTLKKKAPKESGIYRMYWGLNEKGASYPSRSKRKKNTREASGVRVLPGQYKVKLHFGEHTDSTEVKVHFDPRLKVTKEVLQANYDFQKGYGEKKALAYDAMQRLVESKEIVDTYKAKLKDRPKDDSTKVLMEYNKATSDSIEKIMEIFVGEKNEKQGIVRNPESSVSSLMGQAEMYLFSNMDPVGPREKRVVQHFTEYLKKGIDATNAFYEKEWKEYQERMLSKDWSPFKTYETLDMD